METIFPFHNQFSSGQGCSPFFSLPTVTRVTRIENQHYGDCGFSVFWSSVRPCIHRLCPCGVCPYSLVTRHTDNEYSFCLVVVSICLYVVPTKHGKISLSVFRVTKRTRVHTTREQPIDTGRK